MPETIGDWPDIRAHFIKSPQFQDFWRREASEIFRLRTDNLTRMAADGLRQLAMDFGTLPMPDFPKGILISKNVLENVLPREGTGSPPTTPRA
jgi:hypothetical protein